MCDELFLAVIVSVDLFLASASCCAGSIKIPFLSNTVINLICSAILGIFLCLSGFLGNYIPDTVCRICECTVIISLGVFTIAKSIARTIVKKVAETGEMSLKLGKSPLALKLYLDDAAADIDNSKILSAGEAAALAIASSVDCAAIGLSCGYDDTSPVIASVCAFLFGFSAICLGGVIGRKISSLRHDLSWVGGVMLILFALIE